MIANDEALSLTILEAIFLKKGFKVSKAKNGQEAYEKVKQTIDDTEDMFDLVVLDLNMPIANGYEALTNIKKLFSQPKLFEGKHNFKSYCYKPHENGIFDREIFYCKISFNTTLKANFFPNKSYELTVKGKGFMRNQIRLMMGVLVELGRGEVSLDYIKESLSKYNPQINYIAPASGLMLNKVDFIDY